MKSFIVLFLTLLVVIPIYAQDSNSTVSNPQQIMQLGRGIAETLDWHPNGEVLAVGGMSGIWFYDNSLDDLAHFDVTGDVKRLAWSSTGTMLVTLNRAGTLDVWAVTFNPHTLSLVQSWSFNETVNYYAWNFSWSPDCETIAIVTSTGAHILDVRTGEQLLNIPEILFDVTWHPNGSQLASAVNLGEELGDQVRVWDAVTGETIATYTSPDPYLYWSEIQWSPDGSVLVGLTSVPATLYTWDVETGDLLNDLEDYRSEFSAYFDMWWSEDGQELYTTSRYISGRAQTYLGKWDAVNWTPKGDVMNLSDVRQIVKHPNTNIWAFLTFDSQIIMWSMDEYGVLHVQSDHTQPAKMLDWSPDSQHLASANTLSETVQVWNVFDHTDSQSIPRPHKWLDIETLNWTADGKSLRAVLEHYMFTAPGTQVTGFVVELDVQDSDAQVIQETGGHIPHDGSDSYLPFNMWSDDFTRVATILNDEPISISTVETSENGALYIDEKISTIDAPDEVSKLIWSPDNTMIAMLTHDEKGKASAWVYSAETGELINRLRPTVYAALDDVMSWSPDSTMITITGGRTFGDSTLINYRLDIFKIDPLSEEPEHVFSVQDIVPTFHHAWHPNSQAIAVNVSYVSPAINIYPIQDMSRKSQPDIIATIPDIQVSALAWSPDGAMLAGSHIDGTIRVWDVTVAFE